MSFTRRTLHFLDKSFHFYLYFKILFMFFAVLLPFLEASLPFFLYCLYWYWFYYWWCYIATLGWINVEKYPEIKYIRLICSLFYAWHSDYSPCLCPGKLFHPSLVDVARILPPVNKSKPVIPKNVTTLLLRVALLNLLIHNNMSYNTHILLI